MNSVAATSCWQCSGCREVFFGAWKKTCPSCKRDDYWSGSVEPAARAAATWRLAEAAKGCQLDTAGREDESDIEYAERLAGQLETRGHEWGADVETALFVAVKEMRRLRAFEQRLSAIRSRHEQGAVTTAAGSVIYADIRGSELHRLLYGELED